MSAHDDILSAIEHAFVGATMPRTTQELAFPSIDAPAVIRHFFEKTRVDVASDAFSFMGALHMEDFTYMTDDAVQYYLPPVLRIMLTQPDDELWIFLGGFLRGIDGTYPKSSLRALDAAQRSAIAEWAACIGRDLAQHEWMSNIAPELDELARIYRFPR